ncbi:MAG: thioredoxin family protein [Candidatus Peregrinibacteria bacterium]
MKKPLLLAGLSVVLLSGCSLAETPPVVPTPSPSVAMQTAMMDDAMISPPAMMKNEMMTAGSYMPYSVEKMNMASPTGEVVLFFHASWCPTCQALDKDIKANLEKISSGLTILDVDYDNSPAMKQKYGVTMQHTFVQIDKDGNMMKKWTGSPTLVALESQVMKSGSMMQGGAMMDDEKMMKDNNEAMMKKGEWTKEEMDAMKKEGTMMKKGTPGASAGSMGTAGVPLDGEKFDVPGAKPMEKTVN